MYLFFEITLLRCIVLLLNLISLLFGVYLSCKNKVKITYASKQSIYRFSALSAIALTQCLHIPRQLLAYHHFPVYDNDLHIITKIVDWMSTATLYGSYCTVALGTIDRYRHIQLILPKSVSGGILDSMCVFTVVLSLVVAIYSCLENTNKVLCLVLRAFHPFWVVTVEYTLNIHMVVTTLINVKTMTNGKVNQQNISNSSSRTSRKSMCDNNEKSIAATTSGEFSESIVATKAVALKKMEKKLITTLTSLIVVDIVLIICYLLGCFVYLDIGSELAFIVSEISVIHVYISFQLLTLFSREIKKTNVKKPFSKNSSPVNEKIIVTTNSLGIFG
ncbi:hypothetical protein HK099_007824 [Clydaea vesicula]|uniref:Uncharacterized protein n=1 Tax=Clydaea vesicula TaxID=447962 RepID=A0AAD5UBV9_9FUNG|nr:hypothetical protein HK099_007824 [Clydaea vesicula]